MQNLKKYAFTIAEILITLVILGVLFSLYMPTINKSYKKNVTQTTLNDSMKNFNQVLFTYSGKMGCHGSLACTDLFSANDNQAAFKLKSSFSLPLPTQNAHKNNCWSANVSKPSTNLSNYSCVSDVKNVIFATQRLSNCSTNLLKTGTIPTKHKLQKSCGYVYIDVNGTKAPNAFGEDIFVFVITDNAPSYLYPVGGDFWQDNTRFNGAACNGNDGRACAGQILKDNMKIKY